MRHSCEQGDNLAGYHWQEHDGRTSGIQIINDIENNMRLKIELLKTPASGQHAAQGGSWSARISGEPINAAKLARINLATYYSLEGLGGLDLTSHQNDDEEVSTGIDD